jgi:hypothetical protein
MNQKTSQQQLGNHFASLSLGNSEHGKFYCQQNTPKNVRQYKPENDA